MENDVACGDLLWRCCGWRENLKQMVQNPRTPKQGDLARVWKLKRPCQP